MSSSMIVFDKAYNYYHQFALCTRQQAYFIIRMNRNVVYIIIEVKHIYYRKKDQSKVLRDEIVELEYCLEREDGTKDLKTTLKTTLRKVSYQDEQNRNYYFLTNTFDIDAEEVALLFKKRWGIEIFLKTMKQSLQLYHFYEEGENTIYNHVWWYLIAQLLLAVAQKIAHAKKAFSMVASFTRIRLINMLDVNELLQSTTSAYRGISISP